MKTGRKKGSTKKYVLVTSFGSIEEITKDRAYNIYVNNRFYASSYSLQSAEIKLAKAILEQIEKKSDDKSK